jgi:ubiquitin carboxyl-terminal hydrolase 9/24
MSDNDKAVVDLMGSIFDGFISSARSSGLPPICCDKVSRQLAFNVISAAAQACGAGTGYCILSQKINGIIANVAPSLRHRWGQNASVDDRASTSRNTNSVRYSGLKNQGCTCYMNSVLQQLFMMPALRKNLCSAEIPTIIRSSGGGAIAKGDALVGKKIAVQWENGNKYDAVVARYEIATGMHTINYYPIQLASGVDNNHQHQQFGFDISAQPRDLPEEYTLTEGRPGKETGAFEIISSIIRPPLVTAGSLQESRTLSKSQEALVEVKESPDEATSRKLLEEVQRTFVNLDEARGRCFDPRALVEASHCLKLEFDVWQQNDASEFAMKMLDRLEISLKKWSPLHFKYLAHTFGMKKTTQKICRECGLKTNREEDMMNIDCQIRNKVSIHEALSDMCEDEIMEGDNKVLCDSCKVKTNTVLRTAISKLPDVLVLSLKRFDLDYTTFETVKLNSRCEFGEALNMKKYTLQAKEVLEAADRSREDDTKSEFGSTMDLEESETKDGNEEEDPLSVLPDEDYEYRLAGVLVHAGVAQGGHYYSFIKDRTSAKWYRFDDEDVTPFDPSSIEHECFGGKVKKETKFPNGHTHTVESEQFANALMLFYEKVKSVQFDTTTADAPMEAVSKTALSSQEYSNGYDVFLPEVRKSNSTHSWQSFLLTDEFQKFVKEILDLCAGRKQLKEEDDSMDITPTSSPSPVLVGSGIESWRLDGIRTTLSFVFDVLFHLSLKKAALGDWSKILMQIFSSSYEISAMFVSDLAKRTHQVYENWVRAYTMECSEEGSRRTVLQIFACAISSLLSNPIEQSLLQIWTQSWSTQVSEMDHLLTNKRQLGVAMPTRLEALDMRPLEDITKIGMGATSIGIILSYLSELIEVSPRYTQANIELCFLIRELASAQAPTAKILRDAMVEAHFIARLTCLAIRDKTHDLLRVKFPGSSLPPDVVDAISREETLSSNIMQVGMNNSGVHGGGGNQLLLEAIGCLLGTPWIKQEAISFETGEVNRGRNIRALTPRAIEALTAVFEESKPPSSNGMILRDIHHYLQKCGQHVPPQRIDQIFNRHAVDEPDGSKLLTLKGFLAYYRDAVHNNEYQVQKELHAFGFRPDLTRRHDNCRWHIDETNGQKRPCSLRECIANDVVMNRTRLSKIHHFTELGLQALYFLNYAQAQNNNGVVEYLLAASAIGRDSRRLIFESLQYLCDHLRNWSGGTAADGYPLIIMILSVLTAIRDEKQQERIATVMINDDGEERREGLMTKGERIIQDFPNDYRARIYADKHAEIINLLQKQYAVSNWMSRNRGHWTWIEPDAHPETAHPLQSRSDHSGRRGGGHQNVPTHHQNHDPNAEDESDIDEDSRSDEDEEPVREIIVKGCGVPEINGIFTRAGSYDGVSKYTKHTHYRGKEEEFSLFRCKLTDNTRRWYISIVPMNAHPGTTKDIDFYAAVPSPHGEDGSLPPRTNWMCIPNSGGIMPAPEVYPGVPRISLYDEVDENQGPGSIVVDQDQTGYL